MSHYRTPFVENSPEQYWGLCFRGILLVGRVEALLTSQTCYDVTIMHFNFSGLALAYCLRIAFGISLKNHTLDYRQSLPYEWSPIAPQSSSEISLRPWLSYFDHIEDFCSVLLSPTPYSQYASSSRQSISLRTLGVPHRNGGHDPRTNVSPCEKLF